MISRSPCGAIAKRPEPCGEAVTVPAPALVRANHAVMTHKPPHRMSAPVFLNRYQVSSSLPRSRAPGAETARRRCQAELEMGRDRVLPAGILGFGAAAPEAATQAADRARRRSLSASHSNPAHDSHKFFPLSTNPCAKLTYRAVQSPQGVPWPEIFNLRAAIADRNSPSPLQIRRSFRNVVTRPQSVARTAVWQRRAIRGDPATVRLRHRVHL